jgi:quercetin dioxygenase-like cupin family protein
MAHKGQIIRNAVTGEYIEFLETARESNGRHTRFKILQKAGGFKPVMHIHTEQDEIFEIVQGELTYILNNEKKIVQKGETIILPKGYAHTHYNDGNEDLLMHQTVSPSLDFDQVLENLIGLSAEGKIPNGEPKFLQVMIWLRNYQSKTYLAKVPVVVQNTLAFILAPVARLFGYKAAYKRFSGFDA